MKTVAIMIDYFGKQPDWLPIFLLSCRHNPTIDWIIHSDCIAEDSVPANVKVVPTSFAAYKEKVSDALQIKFNPARPYNICNLKPLFPKIHYALGKSYDYVGWGDIDVIYGNIREFYTDSVLERNVISNQADFCSGHLTLIRNECWLRDAFELLTGWKDILEIEGDFTWEQSLDEARLSSLFLSLIHI